MIGKFLRRVFSPRRANMLRRLPLEEHGLSRDQISSCARRTTEGLQAAGFQAYVVGGAVRDLLVGIVPKDFDVATDATPDQVRATFRRSRIIGRRFRLVHVLCGQDTVEVSTFRGSANAGGDSVEQDEHGRILRDNVFGTLEEDALRRDFTLNALFYDPATQEILDYCDGYADLRARRIRVIGDAEQRYREDPVRMMRAARLGAKLGMTIEPRSRAPIASLASLMENVPSARLFDEMLKLLLSGHAREGVLRLRAEGLHHGLLPMLDVILEQPLGERFVMLALERTDERVRADKPVSPAFLFATLLWHEVLSAWTRREVGGEKSALALMEAMDAVLAAQAGRLAIHKRYLVDIKELWSLQPRFLVRAGRRPLRLLEHLRFRAAYDFLALRCESGELDAELAQWWDRFAGASDVEREAMLLPEEPGQKRRRRRRKPAGAPRTDGSGQAAIDPIA